MTSTSCLHLQQGSMPNQTLIFSCDGSARPIKGNSQKRFQCAIGVFLEIPEINFADEIVGVQVSSATSNEAEFQAIIYALEKTKQFLKKRNIKKIIMVSDSKLVIDVINGKKHLSAQNLKRRLKHINGLLKNIKVAIIFVWARRNSTNGLKQANKLAQHSNGVRVH